MFLEHFILRAFPVLTSLSSYTVEKTDFVDLAKRSGNNDPSLLWSFFFFLAVSL